MRKKHNEQQNFLVVSFGRLSKKTYLCHININTLKKRTAMQQQKVDMFMMTNGKYFPEEKAMFIREKLLGSPEKTCV